MRSDHNTSLLTKPSVLLIAFTFCFCIFTMDLWRGWHHQQTNFTWDVMNYYSYLPAKFCNNNSFEFPTGLQMYLPMSPRNDGHLPKVTYGMSILYAPFFALGYKIALNEKENTDGFSQPFRTCIHWGSILYGLLGLIFLRNFLIRYFSEWVTAITLAIIFYGTTVFHYTMGASEMSHTYLFFLISAFLLLTRRWHEEQKWIPAFFTGILLGIISLIRPTEILVSAFFIFWGVNSITALKDQAAKFWKAKWQLLLMALTVVSLWIPQFLFWKERTGNYFFFSYGDEKFFWTDPQIVNILFSYRKGWLTYSPLVWLVFIGFFFMRDEVRKFRPLVLTLLIVNIYMLSCWWDWFFGGGFGARAFTQHLAYLSLPLASFCKFAMESEWGSRILNNLRYGFFAVVFLGISLSLGQSYQYVNSLIHYNAMSGDVYWHILGKYSLNGREMSFYWNHLKEPDYPKLKSGEDRDQ